MEKQTSIPLHLGIARSVADKGAVPEIRKA